MSSNYKDCWWQW